MAICHSPVALDTSPILVSVPHLCISGPIFLPIGGQNPECFGRMRWSLITLLSDNSVTSSAMEWSLSPEQDKQELAVGRGRLYSTSSVHEAPFHDRLKPFENQGLLGFWFPVVVICSWSMRSK